MYLHTYIYVCLYIYICVNIYAPPNSFPATSAPRVYVSRTCILVCLYTHASVCVRAHMHSNTHTCMCVTHVPAIQTYVRPKNNRVRSSLLTKKTRIKCLFREYPSRIEVKLTITKYMILSKFNQLEAVKISFAFTIQITNTR